MPQLLDLSSPEDLSSTIVGGKASALAALRKAGFPVPPGLVLPVEAFEPWLECLRREGWLGTLADADPSGERAGRLAARIEELRLPEELDAELRAALPRLRVPGLAQSFAVRSSSPEEDLEGSSFAGGYESLLGVGEEGLEAAIRAVFASAFAERILAYKRERGYDPSQVRIAVIIQTMVPAEVAGVAFSLNPLNNCYDEALVEASFGLGEALVSGAVEPDRFLLDKPGRRLLETRIGRKAFAMRLGAEGGVHAGDAAAGDGLEPGTRPSLGEAELLELLDLILAVETRLGMPVDLEWARAGGRFHLLQARPVTGYLPLPPELLTPPGAPKLLYANSTLIEQGLDKPLSVLGADFMGRLLRVVGGPVARGMTGPGGVTFTAGGGYYMNLSYALKLGMGKASLAPGSVGDPRIEAILDSIDLAEYTQAPLPRELAKKRSGLLLGALPLALAVLRAYRDPGRALAAFETGLPEALARLEAEGPEGEGWEAAADRISEALEYFYGSHGIPLILAGQLARRRLELLFRREGEEAAGLIAALGSGLPGNKTTEMGEALAALALVRKADGVRRAEGAARAEGRRDLGAAAGGSPRALGPEAEAALATYLAAYGHRCPAEVDAATPRPSERPELLMALLAPYAQDGPGTGTESPLAAARARRAAATEELRALAAARGGRRLRSFDKAAAVYEALGGFRESPKHYLILAVARFRSLALRRAAALVAAGRLDEPGQVFDLSLADLDRAAREPELELRALGRERRRIPDAIGRSGILARILDSRGKVFYPPAPPPGEPGLLRGVPISPGTARGPAKVLATAGEKPLLPGEILVARSTDPGWTPLFAHAAAVVLEIGGALQHGALVAREYGKPCVSGIDGVRDLIEDGDLLEVDGSSGTVRVLAKGEKA